VKKIGLIAIIVVLALGVIGVGYAAWTQVLNVSGSVTAATFSVYFNNATAPTAPTGGTATDVISVPGPTTGTTATLAVTNAYPGWTGNFVLTVKNNSSIPVTLALSGPTGDTYGLFSASGNPSGSIAAGATFDYTITATVPGWTGNTNSGVTDTVSYTITATQAP
jgi:predicted ribosomally synthesized peptide with SipW-like signal peptide